MCLFRRHPLDPESRRILAAGNLCLLSGLMLTQFQSGFGHRHPALYLSLRFLLMGLAIGLLFRSARRAGKCTTRP